MYIGSLWDLTSLKQLSPSNIRGIDECRLGDTGPCPWYQGALAAFFDASGTQILQSIHVQNEAGHRQQQRKGVLATRVRDRRLINQRLYSAIIYPERLGSESSTRPKMGKLPPEPKSRLSPRSRVRAAISRKIFQRPVARTRLHYS